MSEIKTCDNYVKNKKLSDYGFNKFKSFFSKNNMELVNMDKKKNTPVDGYKKAVDSEVFKFEVIGDYIEGTLMSVKESPVYDKSYAVTVKNKKDELITAFVNKIVTDKFAANGIEIGMEVKIAYCGLEKTQDGKREYKNFEVFYK